MRNCINCSLLWIHIFACTFVQNAVFCVTLSGVELPRMQKVGEFGSALGGEKVLVRQKSLTAYIIDSQSHSIKDWG